MTPEEMRTYQREYQRKLRAKRKEQGLCSVCDDPATEGKTKCERCRKRDVENQKRRQAILAEQGICKMCGKEEAGEGHLYCDGCLEKANASTRRHSAKRKSEGRCPSCGIPSDGRCPECKVKGNEAVSSRRRKWAAAGMCRDCGQQAISSNRSLRSDKDRANYCRDCYLKVLARNHLGSAKFWEVLLGKLESRCWRCFYTGDVLVIGDNLSFDHLNPVSRFPEQNHDPANVEPCTWQVNLMKRDLTKEEFLALVAKISVFVDLERSCD